MTAKQLETIAALRRHNYPYSFIGRELGLSINTVKSVCRRKNYKANGQRKTKEEKLSARFCPNCGTVLSPDCSKGQRFCSDRCRRKWWKDNRRILEK